MANVEIFLCKDETQMSFLKIPRTDIERLAVYPFRWIRYVVFAICGAPGDLLTTPNGPDVDYESTNIADMSDSYYYHATSKLFFSVCEIAFHSVSTFF
jgi:hypothetical protein